MKNIPKVLLRKEKKSCRLPKSTPQAPQVPPAVDCSLRDARRRSAGQKSKIAEVNAQQSAVNASKFHWFFLTLKDIDEKDL